MSRHQIPAADRERIVKAALELFGKGDSLYRTARKLAVSGPTLSRWISRFNIAGTAGLATRYHFCGRKKKVAL